VYEATWTEFVARFGTTARRLFLLAGLKAALDALRVAGCQKVYLDGSLTSAKEEPSDFDGCWEASGVHRALLDPILLNFAHRRAAQRLKYGGELFPADWSAEVGGTNFLQFFQRDKQTGQPKGIVAIDLEGLP
jgi:hypothetical protein